MGDYMDIDVDSLGATAKRPRDFVPEPDPRRPKRFCVPSVTPASSPLPLLPHTRLPLLMTLAMAPPHPREKLENAHDDLPTARPVLPLSHLQDAMHGITTLADPIHIEAVDLTHAITCQACCATHKPTFRVLVRWGGPAAAYTPIESLCVDCLGQLRALK